LGQILRYEFQCHEMLLSVRNKSQHYYSLDDTMLQRVSSNPYLGVEFSEDLRWSTHISKISKKASSTLDINRLDRVQRRCARFIPGDYKSRSPSCVTQMLVEHNLLPLQERRKHLRLAFLFKVVEGSVPAIPPEDYLIPQRPKRAVRVRTFKDHITSNIFDSQVTNNSRCFRVPPSKSEPYRHSFFVRTIIDWNQLEDDIVDAPSTEAFRECLANIQSCS